MDKCSNDKREWNRTKFVGNDAENNVSFLINSMPNWNCIKFGVENHIEDLRKVVKGTINHVTR